MCGGRSKSIRPPKGSPCRRPEPSGGPKSAAIRSTGSNCSEPGIGRKGEVRPHFRCVGHKRIQFIPSRPFRFRKNLV
nr:MAG TPA: hypothetical protein [Herelleviridae sp.]